LKTIIIETESDMSIMKKVVAASSAVTALAVGGAIALAVSGGTTPAVADAGPTIIASATNLPGPSGSPDASSSAPADPSSAAQTGAAAPAGDSPGQTAQLDLDQAVAIALARVPGASVGRVEMEPEHGAIVWKIDLVADGSTYELRIDASSGAVVRAEVDGDDDDDDDSDHDLGDDHGGDDGPDHDLGDDHGSDDD
jgi:hypothetical protein